MAENLNHFLLKKDNSNRSLDQFWFESFTLLNAELPGCFHSCYNSPLGFKILIRTAEFFENRGMPNHSNHIRGFLYVWKESWWYARWRACWESEGSLKDSVVFKSFFVPSGDGRDKQAKFRIRLRPDTCHRSFLDLESLAQSKRLFGEREVSHVYCRFLTPLLSIAFLKWIKSLNVTDFLSG